MSTFFADENGYLMTWLLSAEATSCCDYNIKGDSKNLTTSVHAWFVNSTALAACLDT
jgi:hypothetical protein